MPQVLKLAIGSIVVGVVVLALKTLAWWITGSIALLSDALESTVNVATAIAALVAIRVAARPADDNHPWGHQKAEFFSAILEGVMITLAALLILREAITGFMDPQPLDAPLYGLAINIVASVINGIWCWTLITRGRRLKSPALVADGRHLLTDVISSVGVTVGVLVAILTGWSVLDPAMAAIVALVILWSGWRVMKVSMSGLMDEAVSEQTLDKVRSIIATEATGAVQAHDLRTRHAGPAIFIDFHLVVPGDWTVNDAHDMCDRVEAALKRAMSDCIVSIHVEPEEKAKKKAIDIP